jgi:hypothetical protein
MDTTAVEIAKDAESLFVQADRFEEARQFRKAFRCFCKAAELGHTCSQVNLGNYYASGTGVRKDYSKASYWYKRAFRNGSAIAARNLAIDRLSLGDVRSAILWLKKAVEQRDGRSFVLLARIYSRQRGGKDKARRLLRRVSRLDKSQASELDQEDARVLLSEIEVR